MKKITIHTSHENLELVQAVFEELGIREYKIDASFDLNYKGFHSGNQTECVTVETSETLHIELISRLGVLGLVEVEGRGLGTIELDLN